MAMIKLTKQRAAGEKTIYVNTDYIQAVRQHPNVRVGQIPTMVDMMDGATRYQVMESVDIVIEMIRGNQFR